MIRLLQSSTVLFLTLIFWTRVGTSQDWTQPVAVRHEQQICVSYRATLKGSTLIIEANHASGWHTYAMDNVRRAKEKLNGKKSLGIDGPTEIRLEGLEIDGPWYQSPPKELSKPELRWFSWGFDGTTLFAAKVRRLDPSVARIMIHGQACSEAVCKNIEVEIPLSLSSPPKSVPPSDDLDLKGLTLVRP